jgi:hypothetical protein
MKKTILTMFIITLFMTSSLLSSAMAAPAVSNTESTGAGTPMSLQDTNADHDVVISFSPSVFGYYQPDSTDDDDDVQWYAISTYHSGGNNFYGASGDSTALYKHERTATVAEFADVTIPTTAVEVAADDTETAADAVWTGSDWEK